MRDRANDPFTPEESLRVLGWSMRVCNNRHQLNSWLSVGADGYSGGAERTRAETPTGPGKAKAYGD